MMLAHFFSLFRAQNSEQVDLGFHHRVNGFGFQTAHFIGQGPQTRLIQFAGMHQFVHFQMSDPVVGVHLNPHFFVFKLFVLDLGPLRFGQAQAMPETQDVFERIGLVTVSGLAVTMTAVTATVFFGMRPAPVALAAVRRTLLVGGLEGYVHLFSNIDGRPVARIRVGKGLLSGAPVVIGDKLYVQSESGVLEAYAVIRPERDRDAPDIASEGT